MTIFDAGFEQFVVKEILSDKLGMRLRVTVTVEDTVEEEANALLMYMCK